MTFHWVYDLSNGSFALLTVAVFVGFSILGLQVMRPVVRRLFGRHPHNDIIGYFLSTMGVFYGITLGLVAYGTYNTYSAVGSAVSTEATTVNAIYHSLDGYPDPERTQLRVQLAAYVRIVIDEVWPQQREGHVSASGLEQLNRINRSLARFEPNTHQNVVIHSEVLRLFNQLLQMNNARLQYVESGLPSILYVVIIIGALLNIAVFWFFVVDNFALHGALNILIAALLGLLIFLIAAMDNPFRGEYSIGPGPFEFVRDNIIKVDPPTR